VITRKKRGLGRKHAVEVVENRHSLRDRLTIVDKCGDFATRIQLAILVAMLLAAVVDQMHWTIVIDEAFEVERDANAIRSRAAEVAVQNEILHNLRLARAGVKI
jgi:hypothetical protein